MKVIYTALLLFALLVSFSQAQALPQPAGMSIADNATATEILDAFLGIPYAQDGVVDETGRYSYFAKPQKLAASAGLNCSGYTLSAFRFLVGKNITVAESKLDRKGDSGKGAALGEDWDFGWDLIANITEGFERQVLLPNGSTAAVEDIDAVTERGYNLHERETWNELLPRVREGHVYLLSFSQESRIRGYKLVHYHAAFMAMDREGNVWMYQTTGEAGKAYRRNLSRQAGLQEFLDNFAGSARSKPKYILVVEVALPKG
ncbi:MAG: hypothetical protein LBV04_08420 [Deferribacteraceae bacterium]|jgi:hypothetical protein|nr:hypothetical protein [Deferribacteraceae bacterium]